MRLLLCLIAVWVLWCPTAYGRTLYTYEQMTDDLIGITQSYPNVAHLVVIGETPYHRNIYAIEIGEGKPSVVISASHHAREWITTKVTMKMISSYCYAYQHRQSISGYPVRTILNQSAIWFVPMVNPDGVTLQQYGPDKFPFDTHALLIRWNQGRRDFAEWKANAKGIDLNLQYDGGWHWISHTARGPSSQGYKGEKPYQAEEVVALVNFLEWVHPMYEVSYHTSGNVIFSSPPPDKRYLISKDLADLTGYRVIAIKGSYGGLTDWWNDSPDQVGVTIEMGPFSGERPVSPKYFYQLWRENRAVGLYLAARAAAVDGNPLSKGHLSESAEYEPESD